VYGLYYLPLAILTVSLSRWKPLQLPRDQRASARDAVSFLETRRVTRLAWLAQLFAIGLIVVHPFSAGRPTQKLRIDFLDVGQGDSALVTFPDNTTLLIDGGGRPGPFRQGGPQNQTPAGSEHEGEEKFERETRSIGESVVSEYLWWRGLDHVDYILATHADADHIDGLNDVVRNFSVRAALVARTPDKDPEYSRFS
ncbi:MAG: ComEC/Rec2 family competence protein, partial [Pyrinomonadaceae bacterium]